MTVSAAKSNAAAHIRVRSAADTFCDRQPWRWFGKCVLGQRVDLPGVEDDRAVHSLDRELQPFGRRIAHHDLQSIAGRHRAGNANRLEPCPRQAKRRRLPTGREFPGQGPPWRRGRRRCPDVSSTADWPGRADRCRLAAAAWPPRKTTLSEAIHGTSFHPIETFGQAAHLCLNAEFRLGSANQADSPLDPLAVLAAWPELPNPPGDNARRPAHAHQRPALLEQLHQFLPGRLHDRISVAAVVRRQADPGRRNRRPFSGPWARPPRPYSAPVRPARPRDPEFPGQKPVSPCRPGE